MAKSKKQQELEHQVSDLTQDLKRIQADFENYRKRVEQEKEMARANGRIGVIMKFIPVIDNIERAISHVPDNLKDNQWAVGVAKLTKNLEKSMGELDISKVDASKGVVFDPELHEAIQYDEGTGDDGGHEVVAEELQSGYKLGDDIIRHAMVRVTSSS